MTLTDFLLARITEDEWNIGGDWAAGDGGLHVISTKMHDWLMAECQAKRRIIGLLSQRYDDLGDGDDHAVLGAIWGLEDTLRLLALPYADHPDFRDEWRPDEDRIAARLERN